MSTIRFKTFSGSFSRYWNENLKYFFFDFFLVELWFKNDISIHRICPQSGLKHSVDHFQGIGMNIMHIVMVIYLTHQWLLRLDFIRFSHIISCSFYWATIVSLFHHCVSPAVNLHVIPPVSLMALIAWRHSVFLLVFALLLTKFHI